MLLSTWKPNNGVFILAREGRGKKNGGERVEGKNKDWEGSYG